MENCKNCGIVKVEKYKYCLTCFISYRRYLKHKNDEMEFLD